MTTVTTLLHAGECLHIWLQETANPSQGLSLRLGDDCVKTLHAEPGDDYTFRAVEIAETGTYRLDWSNAEVSVSIAYAFDPKTALTSGIRPLHLAKAAMPPAEEPGYHFTPPWGWMNDPNGLCRIDGTLHLFYQHYPHRQQWDNMHWGHAVSCDGVHWLHLPVFLFPREDFVRRTECRGGAFSGSALPAADRSGLRIFFTDHEDEREPEKEIQVTAFSSDLLTVSATTPLIDRRPPIPSLFDDFRDPYVFLGPDGRFKMLVAGRDRRHGLVLLYETDNPQADDGWTFVGVLYKTDKYGPGPAECPCMVPLGAKGEQGDLWALIVSILTPRDRKTGRRNLTLAIVGYFDGSNFSPIATHDIDFGPDCYAFQATCDNGEAVGLAWAANWSTVTKGAPYPSAMTLLRRLEWRGDHLAFPPYGALTDLRRAALTPETDGNTATFAIPTGMAEIAVSLAAPGSSLEITFLHPEEPMTLTAGKGKIEFCYQGAETDSRYFVEEAPAHTFQIFIDIGLVEIYADDGRWCCTKRLNNWEKISGVEVSADAEALSSLTVWELSSARG